MSREYSGTSTKATLEDRHKLSGARHLLVMSSYRCREVTVMGSRSVFWHLFFLDAFFVLNPNLLLPINAFHVQNNKETQRPRRRGADQVLWPFTITNGQGFCIPALFVSLFSMGHMNITSCMGAMKRRPCWPIPNQQVQFFLYVNTFFWSNKLAWLLETWVNTLYRQLGRILVAVGGFYNSAEGLGSISAAFFPE